MFDWSPSWINWYRRLLPSYWVFLFISTHLPKAKLPGPRGTDKVAHVLVFGLLAFCYWKFAETFGRPASSQLVVHAAIVLAVYAAFDEYLQQFVGRSTSWLDWIAGIVSIGIVLTVLETMRRRRSSRSA